MGFVHTSTSKISRPALLLLLLGLELIEMQGKDTISRPHDMRQMNEFSLSLQFHRTYAKMMMVS